MSGPRVWVDENDLRVVLGMAVLLRDPNAPVDDEMFQALSRLAGRLENPADYREE